MADKTRRTDREDIPNKGQHQEDENIKRRENETSEETDKNWEEEEEK